MVRRLVEEGARRRRRAARHRAGAAGRPARLARAVRAPARAAGRGRGPHVLGGRAGAGGRRGGPRPRTQALAALQEKDIVVPERAARAGRRARARVQARADPRRRLRDAAQGGARAGSTSRSAASSRSAPATAPTRSSRCWPSTTAARRRWATRRASTPPSSQPIHAKALHFLEAAGDAAAALYSNPRGVRPLPVGARPAPARRRRRPRADRREAGRRRAAARPRRRGDRGVGGVPRVPPRARRTSSASPTCTARSARRSWHKGERKQAIEHYQKGINLLKDGAAVPRARAPLRGGGVALHARRATTCSRSTPPRRRCAWPSAWARRARPSRAHGIFGRVFGRIGDTAKARENLERSVELARGSDDGETILALLALGHHLEVSEADYAGAEARLRARRSTLARARSATCPPQVELHAGARPARRLPRRLGGRASARPRPAPSSPSARAWSASCACPYALRGLLRWREGDWDAAERLYRRAHELAEQVGWSEVAFYGAVRARAPRCATAATSRRRVDGAGPGARRVRARRADRAVDPGDRRRAAIALAHGRQGRAGARGGRGGGRARRAAALPGRAQAAALEADGATSRPARRSSACARRASAGARSAGRSTPRAASCWPGRALARRVPRPRRRSSAPPPSTSHSAFRIVRRPRARRLRASG